MKMLKMSAEYVLEVLQGVKKEKKDPEGKWISFMIDSLALLNCKIVKWLNLKFFVQKKFNYF